jgi:hypothetical protein
MNDEEKSKSEADTRTLSALLMVVVVATLMMALIAMILPGVLGVVVVVGGIGWFAVMHYVVWGWWLGGYLRRQAVRAAEDRAAAVKAIGFSAALTSDLCCSDTFPTACHRCSTDEYRFEYRCGRRRTPVSRPLVSHPIR